MCACAQENFLLFSANAFTIQTGQVLILFITIINQFPSVSLQFPCLWEAGVGSSTQVPVAHVGTHYYKIAGAVT